MDTFRALKEAGVTGVIAKIGGSNNADFPLYLEDVHQANARAVFGTVAHYWANGQVGTPTGIARRIMGSGLVFTGEFVGWDCETWPNEARIWTPAEVVERSKALAAEGKPYAEQFVYLSVSDLKAADWQPVAALGVKLWVAAWDNGPVLVRHWKRAGVWLRQYTSGSNAEIRKVYDADLDLNRLPLDVWTVEELQAALNLAMPDLVPLDVDNDFGNATGARVGVWQGRAKLVVDHDPGPKTLGTLTRAVV